MRDAFSSPRERMEAFPTFALYCAGQSVEDLARLIWDHAHQSSVFATYPGTVGDHALTIITTVATAEQQLYGPYAHLNGMRCLPEDNWEVEYDPIENNVEHFSVPLFAKVDVKFPVTYGEPDAAAYEAYADELRALAADTPVAFGLEAQGHIPTVEAALSEGVDWQEIGRRIGWDGDTAKAYYERHLARTTNVASGSSPSSTDGGKNGG